MNEGARESALWFLDERAAARTCARAAEDPLLQRVCTMFAGENPHRKIHRVEKFPATGWRMVEVINALDPRLVLDIGCGHNQYKGHIQNLFGIDVTDRGADFLGDMGDLPFIDECADVCLAMGSLNFGDEARITKQIGELSRVTRPGGQIIVRALEKPGKDTLDIYFEWSEARVRELSARFEELDLEHGPERIWRLNHYIDVPREDLRTPYGGDRGLSRLFWRWRKRSAP